MQKFLSAPEACRTPKNPVLLDLIYGWGNEAWSAHDEYLAECIGHALSARGAILECGSGLSTVLVGAIATRRGRTHWALEHSPEWADRTQRYLTRYRLKSVVLCVFPIKDYGEFCWYDIPPNGLPRRFSLVLCDGPPGGTKGGRYGLVPLLRERFEPGCVILLDDAEREQERAIAHRWQDQMRCDLEFVGTVKPFIEMTVRVPES